MFLFAETLCLFYLKIDNDKADGLCCAAPLPVKDVVDCCRRKCGDQRRNCWSAISSHLARRFATCHACTKTEERCHETAKAGNVPHAVVLAELWQQVEQHLMKPKPLHPLPLNTYVPV